MLATGAGTTSAAVELSIGAFYRDSPARHKVAQDGPWTSRDAWRQIGRQFIAKGNEHTPPWSWSLAGFSNR